MDVLFQNSMIQDLEQGEPLFLQGSLGDYYWIILRGSLALFMTDQVQAQAMIAHYRTVSREELLETQELLNGALGNKVNRTQSP